MSVHTIGPQGDQEAKRKKILDLLRSMITSIESEPEAPVAFIAQVYFAGQGPTEFRWIGDGAIPMIIVGGLEAAKHQVVQGLIGMSSQEKKT